MEEYAKRLMNGENPQHVLQSMSSDDFRALLDFLDKKAKTLPRFLRRRLIRKLSNTYIKL